MIPDSWEFVKQMDVEEDFHINQSIVNMHAWIIIAWLREFSKNLFAQ